MTRMDFRKSLNLCLVALLLFITTLASDAATTNIVYTLNATPPSVYTTGQRLVLNLQWQTEAHAKGFLHVRLLSQNPDSATSPALSALLNANGSFAMVPAGRGIVLLPQNLTAGNAAARHSVAIQLYPSANSTTFRGDYVATWPHPLETAALSGSVEVVFCGEGMSLATLSARWQPSPTLFLVK